jgi:hypothetical protein
MVGRLVEKEKVTEERGGLKVMLDLTWRGRRIFGTSPHRRSGEIYQFDDFFDQ